MSGVRVDVEANTAGANKDIDKLNANLQKLAQAAKVSNDRLANQKVSRDLVKGSEAAAKAQTAVGAAAGKTGKAVAGSAAMATNSVASLASIAKTAAAAFLAFQGVSVFNKMADDLLGVQNRLRLVTDGTTQLIKKQNELYRLSRATRSELGSTAGMYVDFTKSLETIGVAEKRITNVVGLIQKTNAMSGSNPDAIKGAMTQLMQGIASGTIRGEELNSVLEQNKYLSTSLMKQLGMNAGSLRKFAEDGNLTTELFLNTLEKMSDGINRDFKNFAPSAAQGMQQVGRALSYAIADFNQYSGFSERFTKKMLAIASAIDSARDALVPSITTVKLAIRNMIHEFDTFSAMQLTVRGMIALEISPLDAVEKYKQYQKVKESLDSFRKMFDAKPEMIEVGARIKYPEFDRLKMNLGGDIKKEIPSLNSDLKSLAAELFNFAKIGITNIVALIPKVMGPVRTVVVDVPTKIKNVFIDLDTAAAKYLRPLRDDLQEIDEVFGGLQSSDNRLERAWAKLFRAESVREFTSSLRELNEQRNQIKLNDLAFVTVETGRVIRGQTYWLQEQLVYLNLMENRLIRIQDLRFDRMVKYFERVQSSAAKMWESVLAPQVVPMLLKLRNEVKGLIGTIEDIVTDSFDSNAGARVAEAFSEGFVRTVKDIGDIVETADKGSISEAFEGVMTSSLTEKLWNIAKALGSAAIGFMTTLAINTAFGVVTIIDTMLRVTVESVSEGLKALREMTFKEVVGSTSDMISQFKQMGLKVAEGFKEAAPFLTSVMAKVVSYTGDKLQTALDIIKKFAAAVKREFFKVYDAVVGHSYWPDMVDGVVEYTPRLFESDRVIVRFTTNVGNTFSGLADRVREALGHSKPLQEFFDAMSRVNLTDFIATLTTNLGAAILAVMGLVFGDFRIKLFAFNYLGGLLNSAVMDAFATIAVPLATTVGGAIGAMMENAVEGAIKGFDNLIGAIPSFFDKFFAGLSPSFAFMGAILEYIPIINIFNNSLVHAITLAAVLYGWFAKKGWEKLGDFIFGKKDKKTKDRGTGLVDYLIDASDVLTKAFRNEKVGPNIADLIFRNKTFAIAAAAALSTALLESVSLIDASVIALPLLLYAILGRDGGSKAMRAVSGVIEQFFIETYKKVASITTKGNEDSLFARIINWPLGDAKPRVKTAMDDLLANVKRGFIQLSRNADLYAAGVFPTIWDAFEGRVTGVYDPNAAENARRKAANQEPIKTPPSQLKYSIARMDTMGSLRKVYDEVMDKPFGNGTRRDYVEPLLNSISELFKGIAGFDYKGLWTKLVVNTRHAFNAVSSIVKNGSDAILSVLSRMPAAVRKIAAAIAISIAMMGSASASQTTDVLSEMAGSVAGIAEYVGIYSAVLLAGLAAQRHWIAATKAMAAEAAALGRALTFGESVKAGLSGITELWSNFANGTMIAGRTVAETFSTISNNIGTIAGDIKKVIVAIYKDVTGLFKLQVPDNTVNALYSVFVSPESLVRRSVKNMSTAINELDLTKLMKGLSATSDVLLDILFQLGKGVATALKEIGKSIWESARPTLIKFAKIGLGVGAAGAIGLMMFGPGNTFVDKLGWAYDQVKAIAGSMLGISTSLSTVGGRKAALMDAAAPVLIGKETYGFNEQMRLLDFEGMSTAQFEVILKSTQETKTALKGLQEKFIMQGKLTSQQQNELEALMKEQQTILAGQTSRGTDILDLLNDVAFAGTQADTSLRTLIKTLLGIGGLNSLNIIGQTINGIVLGGLTSAFLALFKIMRGWPAILAGAATAAFSVWNSKDGPPKPDDNSVSIFGGITGGIMAMLAGPLVKSTTSAVLRVIGLMFAGITTGVAAFLSSFMAWAVGLYFVIDGLFPKFFSETLTPMAESAMKKLNEWAKAFNDWIDGTKSAVNTLIAKEYKDSPLFLRDEAKETRDLIKSSEIAKNAQYLPENVRSYVNTTLNELAAAREEVNRLEALMDYNAAFDPTVIQQYQVALDKYTDSVFKAQAAIKTFGEYGKELFDIATLNKWLDTVSEKTKTAGADIGKRGTTFAGSKEQLLQIETLADKINLLEKQKDESRTYEIRQELQTRIDSHKRYLKQLTEEYSSSEFSQRLSNFAASSGMDAETVKAMYIGNESNFRDSLSELEGRFAAVNARIKALSIASPREEVVSAFTSQYQLKREALSMTPLPKSVGEINPLLQKFGVNELPTAIARSEEQLYGVARALRRVEDAENAVSFYKMIGDSNKLAESQNTLKRAIDGVKMAVGQLSVADWDAVLKLDNTALNAIMQSMGMGSNAVSTAGVNASNRMTASIKRLEAAKAIGDMTAEELARANVQIANMNEMVSEMSSLDKKLLSDLFGASKDTGFTMDNTFFGALLPNEERSYKRYAERIMSAEKSLSKLSANASSAVVKRYQTQIEESTNGMIEVLSRASLRTGKGISLAEVINNLVGIDINDASATTKLSSELLGSMQRFATAALLIQEQYRRAINKSFSDKSYVIPAALSNAVEEVFKTGKTARALNEFATSLRETVSSALKSAVDGGFSGVSAVFKDLPEEQYKSMSVDKRAELVMMSQMMTKLSEASAIPELQPLIKEALDSLSSGIDGKFLELFNNVITKFNALNVSTFESASKTLLLAAERLLGVPVRNAYASGGSVWGAGTATSDSIPAMLSNGEFVVRAKQADKYRPLLERINAGGIALAGGTPSRDTPPPAAMPVFVVNANDMSNVASALQIQNITEERIRMLTRGVSENSLAYRLKVNSAIVPNFDQASYRRLTNAQQANYDQQVEMVRRMNALTEEDIANKEKALNELSRMLSVSTTVFETWKSWANNAQQTITSTVSDFLKGKTSLKDGVKGIFDSITSSYIDAFVKSMMAPLMGDGNAFEELGKMFAKQMLDAARKLFGDETTGGSGGGFLSMLSGLMKFLPFASGGKVSGPGTGTSDSIPAMLSNGEFVVNAAATRKFLPLLAAINEGKVGHFAEGGPVGLTSGSIATPSFASLSILPSAVGNLASGMGYMAGAVEGLGSNVDFMGNGLNAMGKGLSEYATLSGGVLTKGFMQVGDGLNSMGMFISQGFTQVGLAMVAMSKPGKFNWFGAALAIAGSAIQAFGMPSFGSSSTAPGFSAGDLGSGIKGSLPGLKFAGGGQVFGPGTGTSDSIAAMLSNGEFVVNAAATRKFLPLLSAINANKIPAFAEGGLVGNVERFVEPRKETKVATTVEQHFHINVTGDISRQTRKEIQSMMPEIAMGVNSQNKEAGRI